MTQAQTEAAHLTLRWKIEEAETDLENVETVVEVARSLVLQPIHVDPLIQVEQVQSILGAAALLLRELGTKMEAMRMRGALLAEGTVAQPHPKP